MQADPRRVHVPDAVFSADGGGSGGGDHGVFTALFAWKDLMWPLIANNDINKMSLAPGLSVLQGVCMTNKGAMMAGSVIATVPMVILYFIFQKQFMEGIAQSGIKG